MSVLVVYAALPAARQGELALRCEALASSGSRSMLPAPVGGNGVVQQYLKSPPV
jgi:hypothetical protein